MTERRQYRSIIPQERKRSESLSVRLTQSQADAVRRLALAQGMTISATLHRLVTAQLEQSSMALPEERAVTTTQQTPDMQAVSGERKVLLIFLVRPQAVPPKTEHKTPETSLRRSYVWRAPPQHRSRPDPKRRRTRHVLI